MASAAGASKRVNQGALRYLVSAASSALTATWFRGKPLFIGDGSLDTTLAPVSFNRFTFLLRTTAASFSPSVYPGGSVDQAGAIYPVTVNLAHMFLNLWESEFVYVYLMTFLGVVGAWLLVQEALNRLGHFSPWWVPAVSALFYVYSPFYQFIMYDGALVVYAFYCAFPALAYLGLKCSDHPQPLSSYLKYLVLFQVVALLGSVAFTYYYVITGYAAVTITALMWVALSSRRLRAKLAGGARYLGALLFLGATEFYSLSPALNYGPREAGVGTSGFAYILSYWMSKSRYTTYANQLTLFYWPSAGPFGPFERASVMSGVPGFLQSHFWGVALVAASFSPLVAARTRLASFNRAAAPFYVPVFVSAAFAAGSAPPLGSLVTELFVNFWFARAVSQTFTSLIFVEWLGLSVLVGLSLSRLIRLASRRGEDAAAASPSHGRGEGLGLQRRGRLVWLGLAVTLLVSVGGVTSPYAMGLPVFSLASAERLNQVTARITPPQYYRDMVSFVNSLPPEGAVLILPAGTLLRSESWYVGNNLLQYVLNKPVVSGGYLATPSTSFLARLIELWQSGYPLNVGSILKVYGVAYVVFEGDTIPQNVQGGAAFNATNIEHELNTASGISLIGSFGPDRVYSVEQPGSTPEESYWGMGGVRGQAETQAAGTQSQPSEAGSAPGIYLYGFAVSGRVVEESPTPQLPYHVLYNLTSQLESQSNPVSGGGCSKAEGSLSVMWIAGVSEELCTLNMNLSVSQPFFVSYGYASSDLGEVGVSLETTSGGSVGGVAIESAELASGVNYSVEMFPPGIYRGLQLSVANPNTAPLQAQAARVLWAYASEAASPQELSLAEASVTRSATYVVGGGAGRGGGFLLNSSVLPAVEAWDCGALSCTALINSSKPFFVTSYTAYSLNYRLLVDGVADPHHYDVLGSFNGWIVNRTGEVSVTIQWVNPEAIPDYVSLGAWALLAAAFALVSLRVRRTRTPASLRTGAARLG